MTASQWQRIKPLFGAAMQQQPQERMRFIAELRLSDPELMRELTSLVASYQGRGTTLGPTVAEAPDSPPAEVPTFSDGDLILSRFRITRLLGLGGMGEVYEAHDLELGRVALKTIRQDIASNPQMLMRFKREVQLARRVTSPYVCRIHELFIVPSLNGTPPIAFLTMEFLEGRTLADRIVTNEPLLWPQAKAVALQICAGVEAIHEAGIIHRDLKTHNVMLTQRRGSLHAVIMDLGISSDLGLDPNSPGSRVTVPGATPGTPAYMAPEQLSVNPLSPAADIYSLGIVLHELITGRHPFEGPQAPFDGTTLLRDTQNEFSLPPRFLRSRWSRVIQKCLERDPKDRFPSAAAVAQALDEPWPLAALGAGTDGRRTAARRALLAAAVVFLLLAAAAALFWYQTGRPYRPPLQALTWYQHGLAAVQQGTYLKAAHQFERAVEIDKRFLMAHVHLADAWNELDNRGLANEQMLWVNPESARNLSWQDRTYIRAVRATLERDYTAALQFYGNLLGRLPADEKAFGYLDMGRIREKAGDPSDALKAYSQAISLKRDLPSAHLRRGALEALLGKIKDATADFDAAEAEFRNSIDFEGLAEINYQKGFAARLFGDFSKAKSFGEQSRKAAEQIGNVQLESRALTLLSSAAFDANDDEQAEEAAQRAIGRAQESGFDYWAAEGFISLGYAYFGASESEKAEQYLQKALQQARRNDWPKLAAEAELALSCVYNVQGRPDEVVSFANAALDYYRHSGFSEEFVDSETQLVRALTSKKDFAAARQASKDLLELARQHNNPLSLSRAEEVAGSIDSNSERYPAALEHFKASFAANPDPNRLGQFVRLEIADMLWIHGRYNDALSILDSLPPSELKQRQFSTEAARVRANMLLSLGRYAEAERIARQTLSKAVGMRNSLIVDLQLVAAQAEAYLGSPAKAQLHCDEAVKRAQGEPDPELMARVDMAQAIVDTVRGLHESALLSAHSAIRFFVAKDKKLSAWRSFLIEARCYRMLHRLPECRRSAGQALKMLADLEQDWGPAAFAGFTSRSDVARQRRELASLIGS